MANFTSLASHLAPCFDLPLSSLSADQQERIARDFKPLTWDQMGPAQRREFAQDWDRRNRPMTPDETKSQDEHLSDLAAAEIDLAYWTGRLDVTASDAAVKQAMLKKINKELDALNAQHEVLRGDAHAHGPAHSPTPVATQADDWKMKIQIEAAEHMKRLRGAGANPTVHSILGSMVAWCTKNNVRTSTGIIPTANYMRTHVLGAKHWTPPR